MTLLFYEPLYFILYMALILSTLAVLYINMRRFGGPMTFLLSAIIYGAATIAGALIIGGGLYFNLRGPPFAAIFNLAWGVFFGGAIFLAMVVHRAVAMKLKVSAIFYGATLLLLLGIYVDAFLIEPHWLETTELEIRDKRVKKPTLIAVVADIQTDDFGPYERSVLLEVVKRKPDMVLFCGDYIQEVTREAYDKKLPPMTKCLKDLNFKSIAPLGAYAVRGNVDQDTWRSIFADTGIQAVEDTTNFQVGDFTVTALNFFDSFNTKLKLDKANNLDKDSQEKFRIVFGHGPDFSLANPDGDLYVAGHIHGGQVQLPGVGPVVTLSMVPRKWACGYNRIWDSKNLVVSRGIGMERCFAPRLRFLCRPQMIYITLKPQ